MASSTTTLHDYKEKPTKAASESSETSDHYNNDNQMNGRSIFYQELQEDCIYSDDKRNKNEEDQQKEKLEENRILAETEYYREKAAYFRIQKHLQRYKQKS
ncbi:hypothetical protein EVAR_100547_1 [Eumeta japonica]|uniref:Uncharacterized protein n=1 Tax=Eumeta variegata TaxID=151549 RepID=A0A4C1ZL55_EUMVA|nr:hypothetical protein EVAR_100547_1 [Eumeta japonica]